MLRHVASIGDHVIPSLLELRRDALEAEVEFAGVIDRVPPAFRDSARNLAHYLALRRADVRDLQQELNALGLSSLGRSEACVMSTLENVTGVLHVLAHVDAPPPDPVHTSVNAVTGPLILGEHARRLLGRVDERRSTRIMVTMPSEAATDTRIVRDLVDAGMDIMRINMAHDGPEAWLAMIDHLRDAERSSGRTCKVHIDLAGPKFRVGSMEQIRVHRGDVLRFARTTDDAQFLRCEPEAIFDAVRVGDPVWFDDGKVAATVIEATPEQFAVKVTRTKAKGAWIRAEHGLNLPDTPMEVLSLTDDDIAALEIMGPHADLIGMSFVRTAGDLDRLFAHMHRLHLTDRGVVAKIETRDGFENLPQILFAGLRHPPFGIMVARGDLAVEIGFERLAEVQEEMLWLCEAAHVPVIWATQVLEGMAKKGLPTRAEVSDAAMSVRAECVMLNKGPFIVETVQFLSDVLHRMAAHQSKKRSLLRHLHVSDPRSSR